MKKRMSSLTTAIMFTGVILVAPITAGAEGENNCTSCEAAYDTAVCGELLKNADGPEPTCVSLFLAAALACCALFGGCDDSDELIGIPVCFYLSLIVFLQCESSYPPEPETFQDAQ